jgi:cobalamin biosynthesis protein CobT
LLKTRTEATEHYDRIEGELDSDMLYSVPLKNKRIFSQTTPGEAIDTAVSILIDESLSMCSGDRFEGARCMAIALGETLSALAIPFEVIGFDTVGMLHGSIGSRNRTNSMNYRIFKSFDENYRAVKERFGSISYGGSNIDGEAVLAIAKRLASRRETRKILIVLSDGTPECYGLSRLVLKNHLREVVERVTASGIEVLGIGIQTNCVREFYGAAQGANYIVVNDVNKLAIEVYKAFRAMLQGQRKDRRVV